VATQAAGVAAFLVKLIDGSSISTPYNNQGSIPPITSPLSFFSYAAGGVTSHMWVSWGWNATTVYRADGTSISVPAAPAAPAAPTLTDVAGGALGARTDFVRICLQKGGNLYPVSAESSRAILANRLLKVTSPTNPGGYDGWRVLISATTNTETIQVGLIAFGTDFTEPSTGFTTNLTQWSANWKSITFPELNVTTTYYYYPYYDPTLGFIRIAGGFIAQDAQEARKQNADTMVPLSFGAMTGLTPTTGNSGSGNGGGGKFL